MPTAIKTPRELQEDILDISYEYDQIRFRIKTKNPLVEGKLYNISGQEVYSMQFQRTDEGVYEAIWNKDANLPKQILIFSDGKRAAKKYWQTSQTS